MIDQAIRGWRPYALLLLLCLGLYLPGIASLPVTDRDEARFAQATRQMLESRDFIAIRFQDEARNKKPGGIYWLQAAAVALVSNAESNAIWPYRLPSLLGASGATLLTFGLGQALVGRKAAFLGAALLAASLGLVSEAHLAKTDAVLLAATTAAQLALARLYRDAREEQPARWSFALLFWIAMALAILVKGPVAPLLAVLTIAALVISARDYRWLGTLRPVSGLILLALIVVPWLVAISTATQGAFLSESLGTDFFGKLIGAQESHGAPPLYYLALLSITFWPGALFLGPAIAWGWQSRRDDAMRFLLAWAVPFWIALELIPTKLPNYLLPVYPSLALLAGSALVAASEGRLRSWRWLDRLGVILWGVVTLALAAALLLAPVQYGTGLILAGATAAAIAVWLGQRSVRLAWRGAAPHLAARTVLLALFALPLGFAFVAPQLDALWLSRNVAILLAQAAPGRDPIVAATGYAEPSLVFMLGTKTLLASADRAAQHLATTPSALALVESREDTAFQTALAPLGQVPKALGRVSGLDYSNGRQMVLTLYAGAPK
jgi:4-amino-4-deoxy-L-arabinose transferase-like glycosyltransferase